MLIVVYAGPNGAGKSSLFSEVSKELDLLFINPDKIAKDLFSHIPDEVVRYKKYAMPLADDFRKMYMENGDDFSFETVLSTPSKIQFLADAKKQGYDVYSIYIGTNDPSINIDRVAYRVSKGGHNVPTDKIIDRYYKAMNNLPDLLNLSKEAVIVDNSSDRQVEVLYKSEGKYYLLNEHDVPEWVKRYIIEPMMQKGYLPEYPTCLESEPNMESLVGVVKISIHRMDENSKQGVDEWKREMTDLRNSKNKADTKINSPTRGKDNDDRTR